MICNSFYTPVSRLSKTKHKIYWFKVYSSTQKNSNYNFWPIINKTISV